MSRRILFIIYDFLILPFSLLALRIFSIYNSKIAEMMMDRKKFDLAWIKKQTESFVKPIWIHAASGEFEYAKSVIRELKKQSKTPIIVSYFSPSFKGQVIKFEGVDFSFPLPFDRYKEMKNLVKIIGPKRLLIARTDLWPHLLKVCREFNVPTILFSARLSFSHFGFLKKMTLRWLYKLVDRIYVVSEEDREQFSRLGVATEVAGDTRYDQVLFRLSKSETRELKADAQCPILIFGSTWPEDEDILLQVLPALSKRNCSFVLAPHEVPSNHLKILESSLQKLKLKVHFFSQLKSQANYLVRGEVLILDRVGHLAELYKSCDFAFVGGSFRKSVHSVMEPLAAGLPTVVGPFHTNNREALVFKAQELHLNNLSLHPVVSVSNSNEMLAVFEEWLATESSQMKQFRNLILKEVQSRVGASQKVASEALL
jgi:3-deoxy-D-manno-octulosonic-acid transferase